MAKNTDFMKMYDCEYQLHLKLMARINNLLFKYKQDTTNPLFYFDMKMLHQRHFEETLEISRHWDSSKIERI
jgi:hypothetical protein